MVENTAFPDLERVQFSLFRVFSRVSCDSEGSVSKTITKETQNEWFCVSGTMPLENL
jgi:hypothetical protein